MESFPLYVVLVTADESLARDVEEHLPHGWELRAVPYEEAVALLAGEMPDAVLLELAAAPEGLGAIEELHRLCPWSAVVALLAAGDSQTGLAALRYGAHDVVPVDEVGRLFQAVRYSVERRKVDRAVHHSAQQHFQAQKMEAIGRVSAGLTHDFRNLVTIIRTNLHVLRRLTKSDPPLLGPIDEIELAARKASDLVEQLLQFARDQSYDHERLDLAQVVRQIEPLVSPLTGHRVQLKLSTDGPLPVDANTTLIEQSVINLVVNAVDAMPDGGTLGLETSELWLEGSYAGRGLHLTAGRYAVLTVWDTGTGIQQEHIPHIFEPFFTTKPRGTGIGLSTVYTLTRGMSGEIGLATRHGVGTAMRIFLPHRGEGSAPPTSRLGSRVAVLVLEGHATERLAVLQRLEELGVVLLEARNAAEALRICATTPVAIDWLLADLFTLDGQVEPFISQCRELRPELSVALTSNFPRAMLGPVKWSPAGLPVLEKPLSRHVLMAMLASDPALSAPAGRSPRE